MLRVLLILSLLLAGCAPNEIIRNDVARCEIKPVKVADPNEKVEPTCPRSYNLFEPAPNEAKDLYELAVVEFDDQGLFRDRAQMDNALHALKRHERNVDIIMFIHGWHHSAAADDPNLNNFQTLLHRLAARNSTRHIVGVYVGWRGDTLTTPVIQDLTFWDRKNTSIEVGRGAVYELIERLRLDGGRIDNSRLITIGHSFGASVLLSISKNEVYRDLIKDRDEAKEAFAPGLEPVTILINPAIEAMHFLSLYELPEETARIDASKYASPRAPRIAVFMSESDSATRKFFRWGRIASTLFESHETVTRKNRKGEDVQFSEYLMDTQALGHYEPFITHKLSISSPHKDVGECQAPPTTWHNHLLGQAAGEGWQAQFGVSGTTLTHEGNSPAFSPVWVVKVAEDIIPNHNDIWDTRFNCFLEELVLTR